MVYFHAMKKTAVLVFFLISFALFPAADLSAQQVSKPRKGTVGSWRLLGNTVASHMADHDIIVVAGPFDYFRRIKLKVTNSPLHLQRMVVRYQDGGLPEKIDIRYLIPQGGESRIIDLKGTSRKLKSVEYWYDTKGILNGKANVTLFGLK